MSESQQQPPHWKPRMTFTLDHDTKDALVDRASRLGRSRSWFVNYVLRPALGLPPREAGDKDDYDD